MTTLQGRIGLMLISLAWLQCTVAVAQDYQAGAIKIVQPWTRQTPAAAKVAGGFMTIVNTGTAPDRLIGGTIVNAARFEVHEMSVTDGVMRMRQLQTGLEIKPGETVVLKPGSYHVMFMDLTAAPQAGQRFKGTLVFEKAGTIEVEYKVEPASAAKPGGAVSNGHGSGSGAMKNGNQ
jgi:periplasmic copper chaperone A